MNENRLKSWPDWLVRAVKTFVQAFFGVLAPEVVVILQHGWPESWSALWGYLAPIVAAALAAAISAVWNILLEAMRGTGDLALRASGGGPHPSPSVTPSPEGKAGTGEWPRDDGGRE